ncbi:hypothetical protein GEMRC1_008192 [Eukaryota sp. GEM-RC1]
MSSQNHSGQSLGYALTGNKYRKAIFTFFQDLQKLPRHNFLVSLLLVVEFLQLIALVINRHFPYIHEALDTRHFLQLLAFSGYDDAYFSVFSHSVLSIIIVSIPILLGASICLCGYLAVENRQLKFLLYCFKVLLEFVSSFLFLPLTITAFTWFNCSDDSPYFSIAVSSCWSAQSVLIKTVMFLSWLALSSFVLLRELVLVDVSPNSKRAFCSLNRDFKVVMLIVKVLLAFLLTVFDHLPLVFTLTYPICCIFLCYYVVKWIPFYKRNTNEFVAFISAFTATVSVIWLFISLVNLEYASWIITLIIYFLPLGVGIFVKYYVKFRYSCVCFFFPQVLRLQNLSKDQPTFYTTKFLWFTFSVGDSKSKPIRTKTLEPSFSADKFESDDVSSGDDQKSVSILSDLITKHVTSPIKGELFSRFLIFYNNEITQPIGREIVDHCITTWPDHLASHLLKCSFDIGIAKDPISALSSCATVVNMELDLRFDFSYFISFYKQLAENLRREQSTGQSLDSSSFLILQRRLKTAVDLHRDCLDYLAAFWSILLAEKPNLSLLPQLTEKIYTTKTEAEYCFNKLLTDHPGDKEVLTAFSNFTSEVCLDEELALQLQTQVEMGSSSDGRSSTGDAASSRGSHATGKSSKQKSRLRRKRKTKNFLLGLASSRNISDSNQSVAQKLKISVHVSLAVLLILCIISYVLIRGGSQDLRNQYSIMFESGHFASSTEDLAVSSLFLASSLDGNQLYYSSEVFRHRVISESEHALFHLRRLLVGARVSPNVRDFTCVGGVPVAISALSTDQTLRLVRDPVIPTRQETDVFPPVPQIALESLTQLGMDYCRKAFEYARDTSDISRGQSILSFLISNRGVITDGSIRLLDAVKNESEDAVYSSVIIDVLGILVNLSLIFLMAKFLFGKTVKEITLQQLEIFNLFLYVPKKSVQDMLNDSKFTDTVVMKQPKSFNIEEAVERGSTASSSSENDDVVNLNEVQSSENLSSTEVKPMTSSKMSFGLFYVVLGILIVSSYGAGWRTFPFDFNQ